MCDVVDFCPKCTAETPLCAFCVRSLHAAFEASGLSVAELLDKSGLALERSTLHRKLTGEYPVKRPEALALAAVLGHAFAWQSSSTTARAEAVA